MAITHNPAIRTDIAGYVFGKATAWNSGSNHKLVCYNGTPPANAGAALSGNTAVATLTGITWNAQSGGAITVSASTADSAAAGGTPTFFRIYRTAGADPGDVIIQGTVGTSGTDAIINNSTVAAGASVSLTGSNAYSAPP
jgi:hypothetical protein